MVATPVSKRAQASIPSKFETTLLVGTKERNGFGNRSHRFKDATTEVPGPGQYGCPKAGGVVVRQQVTCGSVSSRGFGTGFVSKTDRFREEELRQRLERQIPGPGTYASALPSPGPPVAVLSASGSEARGGRPREVREPRVGDRISGTHLYTQPKHFRGTEPLPAGAGGSTVGPGR